MTDSSFGWQKTMPRLPPLARQPSAVEIKIRSNALSLAVAGGVDYGLQLVVPFFLVRLLDPTVFGQYRLLWLMAGTVMAIAPAFMPQALFYFLTRAEHEEKGLQIGNVMVYLAIAACVVSVVTSGWNPLLPVMAEQLFFQTHGISTLFISLWVVASLLDVLPTAEGRAHWQSSAIISLAVFRTLILAGVAFASCDIGLLVSAMLSVAIIKLALLAYYLYSRREGIQWQLAGIKKQLTYCLPFAIGNALFLLRTQADQWVVASMLVPAQYAIFSIASAVLPVASLIRQPMINAMMAELNRAQSCGNFKEVSQLIAKTNGAIALFLLPICGILYVTTPELINIVYTSRYCDAVPIMRVYLIGMMIAVFAVGHVLPALERGRFAAINSAFCLVLSITLSVAGINRFGMVGAALGSVLTLGISEFWSVLVVSRTLGSEMRQLLAWRILRLPFFATSLATLGALTLGEFVSGKSFQMLMIKGLAYVTLYGTYFLLFGGWKSLRSIALRRHTAPIDI